MSKYRANKYPIFTVVGISINTTFAMRMYLMQGVYTFAKAELLIIQAETS